MSDLSILGITPDFSGIKHMSVFGNNHDSGACLLEDGEIVAIAEEERFTRVKKAYDTFPKNSIQYVLENGNKNISEIDMIAVGREPRNSSKYLKNQFKTQTRDKIPTSPGEAWRLFYQLGSIAGIYHGTPAKYIENEINDIFRKDFDGEFIQIPHHKCHAASALYCSDFKNPLTLTIDGRGEHDSTVVWDTDLDRREEFLFPNSIGFFYRVGTQYLGFRGFQDAGKVMGLAPYGEHRDDFAAKIDELVTIGDGQYSFSNKINNIEEFEKRFGPRRHHPDEFEDHHKDFAYHLQKKTEEIVTHLVDYYTNDTQPVALAGGVALNCKLNREILNLDCVDDIFIQPAAGDSGICLGAALVAHKKKTGTKPSVDFTDVYTGPGYSNDSIETILDEVQVDYERVNDISKPVAELLAEGDLVGWFQGRMEFGPRALGNRSILANPMSEKYRDDVNKKVKYREKWRPFAPSLLYEARNEYFVGGDESPFMILTDTVKREKRDEIPAVVHVDGTARGQTVREDTNKRYYNLIKEFEKITGVPVLLNTSFNTAGEPIVESPRQAIADFFTTGLDALAIGNYILKKNYAHG